MVKMSGRKESFSNIVSEDSKLERLATCFQFTEGPVWNASEEYVLFSDIPADRIYKWSPNLGVTVFREPSHNSNGLTYDKKGRLIICEHGTRRLSCIETNGTYTVLVDKFYGKRLNSPNDVTVRSDGLIYFTDPPYGIDPEEQELSFQGVFCLNSTKKETTLLADDFDHPNGLAFSPDEKTLYIAETPKRHIRSFDVNSDGTLSNNRIFAEIHSELQGNPDGMKVDVEGNLYVAAAGGIWVISKEGMHLGVIKTPDNPSNCAWTGKDWQSLFITVRTSVYRIKLKIPGIKVS